ncbi:MAG: c-type cytochrome [Ichthyobacteriaceae bacterium]|nr:c-type cytochrome [Ichthyobacteriaceae bacterium]
MDIKHKNIIKLILSLSLFFVFSLLAYAEGDPNGGKRLFKQNCASCHRIDKRLIGPAMQGISNKRSKEWLQKWIKNSEKLIKSGDVDAIAIFEEYDKIPMPKYFGLSNNDIDDIMAYVDFKDTVEVESKNAVNTSNIKIKYTVNYHLLFIISVLVIVVISWVVLWFYKAKLPLYINVRFVYFTFIIVLIFISFYAFWQWTIQIDINTGYQPIQPIKFSHKVHSGTQAIDCQYCHSGSRTSKVSGIPSANVCMNCHNTVQEGTDTGKDEIAKIYKAIGYNPETNKYYENYNQKAIKWVRVHNLPDFVNYNHSQHINIGGLECQECHGAVEEMDELYQFSTLTMEWCVDCHRTKNIDVAGNKYYEEIHNNFKLKLEKKEISVEEMGGLECGKCHY